MTNKIASHITKSTLGSYIVCFFVLALTIALVLPKNNNRTFADWFISVFGRAFGVIALIGLRLTFLLDCVFERISVPDVRLFKLSSRFIAGLMIAAYDCTALLVFIYLVKDLPSGAVFRNTLMMCGYFVGSLIPIPIFLFLFSRRLGRTQQ
jgi:hypothetical protein